MKIDMHMYIWENIRSEDNEMVDNCAGDRARGSWLTLFMKEKGYEGYEDQRDFKEE